MPFYCERKVSSSSLFINIHMPAAAINGNIRYPN